MQNSTPKTRRQDAGRRVRGSKLYDSSLGITCHFCRQKTVQAHVYCRICVIAFCGRCLLGRHGEDIGIEKAADRWTCPKCRGGCGRGCQNCCNCGPCRIQQNLAPPKIDAAAMRSKGFNNVHDFLIHLHTGEDADTIAARKVGKDWCKTVEDKFSMKQTPAHSSSHCNSKQSFAEDNFSRPSVKPEPSCGSSQGVSAHASPQCKVEEKTVNNQCIEIICIDDDDDNDGNENAKDSDAISSDIVRGRKRRMERLPSCLRIKDAFKEKLEARVSQEFSALELEQLMEEVTQRKPVYKARETRHGTSLYATRQTGYSYLNHHPDLDYTLGLCKDDEEKLKILRGFFFWLEAHLVLLSHGRQFFGIKQRWILMMWK